MASTTIELRKTTEIAQIFRGHIAELDGLRAFGITTIIVAHMWPYPQGSHREMWNLLHLSWVLMDCFFVLSGFLIAAILLDSRSRPDYYRSFYTRRALRILPVYYLLLLVLTIGVALHGSGYLYPDIAALHKWGSSWWYYVYLGNVPPSITGVTPSAARGCYSPLWSLQIEEQFYLLFPLLVRRLSTRTLWRTLWALVCFSPLLRIALYFIFPENKLVQYVALPCRMDGLSLGALIALRSRMGPWNPSKAKLTVLTITLVAITGISAAWSGYDLTRPFNRTVGFLISPMACACVVLWLIRFRGSGLTACLRISPLQHLAKISYSAYLFHCPVAVALVYASGALGVGWLGQGHARVWTVLVMTVLVSTISWFYFESPMLRLKERLFPRQVCPSREAV